MTSWDSINGGNGLDTLNVSDVVGSAASFANVTLKSVETISLTSTTGLANAALDLSAYTDVTTANVVLSAAAGNESVTVASTTDLNLTDTVQAGRNISVLGGKNVVLTNGLTTSGTTTVGSTTAGATGAVTVTNTGNYTDGASNTLGTIAVTGGTTVSVTQNAGLTAAEIAADLTDNDSGTITLGAVTVTGTAVTTAVTVNQTAAQTEVDSTTVGKTGIVDGAVTVNDVNRASATAAGTIDSVTLGNYGNATIDSSALTTVTLSGTGGTLDISRGALTAVPTANTLTLNTNALTGGLVTDAEAAADDGFTTINLNNTGTTSLSLTAADLTTLNIAGSGALTLSAQTLANATTITSTSTGSVTLGTALGTSTSYTGGDGADTITVGATTKAINTGAGDDVVTVSVAVGTGGSIDGGAGTNTVSMSAANAVSLSGVTTFEAGISNFQKLSVGADGGTSSTINLNNIDDINYVTLSGINSGTNVLSNVESGFTLVLSSTSNSSTQASLENNSTADVLNVTTTNAAAVTVGTLVATGFETVNWTATETGTLTTTADTHTATITDADLVSLNITGNATAALTFTGTALTSLDASAKTRGGVTLTTGALAGASTLKGGDGADTLNAQSAVAAVTLTGNAGNDSLTGSRTVASTLSGGAGTDTLTGGAAADVIDGGDGVDTFVFSSTTVVEQAGSGTTKGVVINLGSTDLTASAIYAATVAASSASYLNTAQASVAAGTATYAYDNESSTNAIVVDTLTNIENATGTALADYIVGSDGTNVLVGGDGIDVLSGGAGNDYLVADASGQNNIDQIIGGTGDDTYEWTDASEADIWVETATGGTDTIYVASDLSLAGLSVGTTVAGAAANGSLVRFEKLALGAGVDVVFNSAQVTGLTLEVSEAAAGTSSVTVNASAATSAIDLSGFTFNPTTYVDSTGTSVALSALTSGTDLIIINGGTGVNAIKGTSYADVITAGDGLDTIDITQGGADKIVLGTLAADADTITGFTKANDVLDLSAALGVATLTIGTQVAFTGTKVTNIAAVTTAANTDAEVYYIKNTAGVTGEMSLTEIETAITAGSAATGQATILIDNGTDTLVYFDLAAQTDAGSGAGLILVATLVGITGATALATGDLISV